MGAYNCTCLQIHPERMDVGLPLLKVRSTETCEPGYEMTGWKFLRVLKCPHCNSNGYVFSHFERDALEEREHPAMKNLPSNISASGEGDNEN